MTTLVLALIYLAFISLGLPDAVLGSAWPLISSDLNINIDKMGIVVIIISAGTIISSLNSNRILHKIGVHKVTSFSILITAVSLLGFATSPSFLVLCLWSIPYGLGAGNVDAALNNYVAVNFENKHMNWLHCMWGLGATLGPYIMGIVLTGGHSFRTSYVILFIIQAVLFFIILSSSPVWKIKNLNNEEHKDKKILTLKEIFRIPGVKQISLAFFCFCTVEQTAGLWASSYLVYNRGINPEAAAGFGALFYFGITVGRFISGFISMRFTNKQMIRGGSYIMVLGVAVLFIPFGTYTAFIGITLIGLGSSPIYPSIIHSTPQNFGIKNSQAITGVQMATAYTGTLTMPALFGIIGKNISFALYPVFILIPIILLLIMYESMLKKVKSCR